MAYIKQGSTGDDVKELQQKLSDLGYYTGEVDGIFGPKTYSAVTSYQGAKGLDVDGIVGPQTWGSLNQPKESTTPTETPAVIPETENKTQEEVNAADLFKGAKASSSDTFSRTSDEYDELYESMGLGSTNVNNNTSNKTTTQETNKTESSNKNTGYTVVSGDTLWGISQKNGIAYKDLLAANPQINNPDDIYAGQVINFPTESNTSTKSSESTSASSSSKNNAGYTIKSGDTLTKIAQNNNTSVQAILDANPQIKDPDVIYAGDNIAIPSTTANKSPESNTSNNNEGNYTIQSGDTLSKIAKENNTTVQEIVNANPQIKDPDLIYAGDNLVIPGITTNANNTDTSNSGNYTIKDGDNLTKIAQEYGTTIQAILDANPYIKNPDLIYSGDKLVIPGNTQAQSNTQQTDTTEQNNTNNQNQTENTQQNNNQQSAQSKISAPESTEKIEFNESDFVNTDGSPNIQAYVSNNDVSGAITAAIEYAMSRLQNQQSSTDIFNTMSGALNTTDNLTLPSWEEAMSQAASELNPAYDTAKKNVVDTQNLKNVYSGFYGQMPGDVLVNQAVADVENQRAGAVTNRANELFSNAQSGYADSVSAINDANALIVDMFKTAFDEARSSNDSSLNALLEAIGLGADYDISKEGNAIDQYQAIADYILGKESNIIDKYKAETDYDLGKESNLIDKYKAETGYDVDKEKNAIDYELGKEKNAIDQYKAETGYQTDLEKNAIEALKAEAEMSNRNTGLSETEQTAVDNAALSRAAYVLKNSGSEALAEWIQSEMFENNGDPSELAQSISTSTLKTIVNMLEEKESTFSEKIEDMILEGLSKKME